MPDYGDGSPRENYGAVDPGAPSVANGQITPEQWAEYQSKRKRDLILGLLGVFGATTGLGAAGAAMSGGAGAAASAAPGALPPIAGAAPWSVTPYATTATMAGTGAGAAAAGTGGAAGIFAGMSARDLAALGLSAAGTIGGMVSGGKPDMNPNTATTDPNLKALMDAMQRRLDKSEPLYDSVLNMANGLLPTQYQKGGGGMP